MIEWMPAIIVGMLCLTVVTIAIIVAFMIKD